MGALFRAPFFFSERAAGYWGAHMGSGGSFGDPPAAGWLPVEPEPKPVLQRSTAVPPTGAAGVAVCGRAGAIGGSPAPVLIGRLGRLTSPVPGSEPAVAPPLIWTDPASVTGLSFAFDAAAPPPHAAISRAEATRRARSLSITTDITQEAPCADALHAE